MLSTSFWPAKSWESGSVFNNLNGRSMRRGTYDASFGYALEEVAHDLLSSTVKAARGGRVVRQGHVKALILCNQYKKLTTGVLADDRSNSPTLVSKSLTKPFLSVSELRVDVASHAER